MTHSYFAVPILALALWAAAPAQSATVTSYSRVEFENALAGQDVKTETFDTYATGTSLIGPISESADIKYSSSAGNVVITDIYISSSGANGIAAGSAAKQAFKIDQTVTFTFTMSISAFAIDINSFAGKNGAFKAFTDTGAEIFSLYDRFLGALNSKGNPFDADTGQFLGFSSDTPFNSVTLANASGVPLDAYTLDTLKYVTAKVEEPEEPEPAPVPLPAGLPLLLSGLAIVAGLRRR